MKYIWDTNIAIYYLNKGLNANAIAFIDNIPESTKPILSVITEIELLGWPKITEEESKKVKAFIANSTVLTINDEIKGRTIIIKQQKNIKRPDALIAATAIAFDLTLLSRNEKDFLDIKGLKFVNPFNG